MSGWIKLHRSLLTWEWYDDANTLRLFLHCCLRANFEDGQWRGIEITRGQYLTSVKTLSAEIKLSESKIRLSLKKLISTNEITIKTTSQNSMITVCNYDTYNSRELENNKQNNKQPDKPTTNKQQTNNNQTTTNKKNKKKEEEQKLESAFEIFWADYPKKINNANAKKTLFKYLNEGVTIERICEAMNKSEALRTERQFIPNPQAWLNQTPWLDEAYKPMEQHEAMSPLEQAKLQRGIK